MGAPLPSLFYPPKNIKSLSRFASSTPLKGRLINCSMSYKPLVQEGPGSIVVTNYSHDRDLALAEVEKGKRASFIKAWEETEKAKAENKAQKKIALISSWENSKKASKIAELRRNEEKLEKKKAEYGEKMKNKVATIHKQAEEKKAITEANRGKEQVKAEEMAAKYYATGVAPKKYLNCF